MKIPVEKAIVGSYSLRQIMWTVFVILFVILNLWVEWDGDGNVTIISFVVFVVALFAINRLPKVEVDLDHWQEDLQRHRTKISKEDFKRALKRMIFNITSANKGMKPIKGDIVLFGKRRTGAENAQGIEELKEKLEKTLMEVEMSEGSTYTT